MVSALPFEVLGEYGPKDGFQRGVLHIYYQQVDLHVLIIHLHAHSSEQRVIESNHIINMIKPLLMDNKSVIIMGDFNTLSPWDAKQHDSSNLKQLFLQKDPVRSLLSYSFIFGYSWLSWLSLLL